MIIDGIEKKIEYVYNTVSTQNDILRSIKDTKAYKLTEGYHFLKEELKSGNLVRAVRGVGSACSHVHCKGEDQIGKVDPLSVAIHFGTKIEKDTEEALAATKIMTSFMEILFMIEEEKMQGRKPACILAPLEAMDLPDGYSRRIKNIDGLFPENVLRIYISESGTLGAQYPECCILSDKYISVKYSADVYEQRLYAALIANIVGYVYVHSVYQNIEEITSDKNIKKIYDFHGVVPEEIRFMGNPEIADILEQRENDLIFASDYIVTANYAMKEHIMSKYPNCCAEFIIMPMNNEDNDLTEKISNINGIAEGKPIAIYAGGLQKWQLIEEMQKAMKVQNNLCQYRIFVPDPEAFLGKWGDENLPADCVLGTKTANELKKEYRDAQYGFVLRDDIIVNKVACPTKLIDYIKYGIIPIMKTPSIGDFQRNGIEYVAIEDFLSGNLPNEESRRKMSEKNMEILESMLDTYKSGKKRLEEVLFGIN